MRFHLLICKMCKKFSKHVHFLQEVTQDEGLLDRAIRSQRLSPKARDRIREALDNPEAT